MENMKTCPQCGANMAVESKFCGECGYQFPVETINPTPVQPITMGGVSPTPVQPINASVPPVNTPVQPINAQVPPVNTPVQPINAPVPPVNTPVQPINAQVPPVNTPVQPINAPVNPQMNAGYTQPVYSAAPVNVATQKPPKKGKGGLIAVLSVIGVLVLVAVVLAVGVLLGWFKKKTIELSEAKVTVVMEEEVTVEVTNYEEIKEPELTVESSDEKIATVEVKDEVITVTGVEEGKVTITITAKGCEDASFKVTVEEPELPPSEVIASSNALNGTAWDAAGMQYYFLDDGSMYLIYSQQEDYIKGTYSVTGTNKAGAADRAGDSVADELYDEVPEGYYYIVDVDVEQELLYGSAYSNSDAYGYYLVVCSDGSNCAIYDSGWDMTSAGTDSSVLSKDELDSYFDIASTVVTEPDVAMGTVPGIYFEEVDTVKETWHVANYDDILIYKMDGNLWGVNENGGESAKLTDLESGSEVTIMAVYGDYLIYGVGDDDTFYADTNALYKVDLTTNDVTLITDDISIKDFIIYNDYIYYTDYSDLYKMDLEGNTETLWSYGVLTFEIGNGYVFIFDGYEWEAIDPDTGDDYGSLVTGIDGAYEADVVRHEDETLFYVAYTYDDSNIYLYAVDYDGNMIQIGDSMWGETYDTYNVVYDEEYVYYTTGGGESVVKTDVTTGEQEVSSLSNYDYYYATGMVQVGDHIYLYAWDYSGDPHYLELDKDTLAVEEVSYMTAE